MKIMKAFSMFLWMTGCAVLSNIPGLDTPDGQIYARRCGSCHGTTSVAGHGVPDPRFRTLMEWQEILPKMESLIHARSYASDAI
jgi:mono/diheme cytochrome c family protein